MKVKQMHKSNIADTTVPMSFTVARSSKLTIGAVTAERLAAGDLAYMDFRRQMRFEAQLKLMRHGIAAPHEGDE